jgi:hypothetical protein
MDNIKETYSEETFQDFNHHQNVNAAWRLPQDIQAIDPSSHD